MMDFRRILPLMLSISIADLQIAASQEYIAAVTAYPENGPFRSRQLVPLQCTIIPTPPFPVEYIWRSSTQNHYPEASFPSTTPITTITISENHPLHGRYFCHILSASSHTTLAVGHVDIQVKGLLSPIGTAEVIFTPPTPLQFMVGLAPDYSGRTLLDSFRSITYEWRHNDTIVILNSQTRGRSRPMTVTGNRLEIPRTTTTSAGTYSSRIDSFGSASHVNKTCATIVLQALRNYAIFQPVEFRAISGGLSTPMKSISINQITRVHFTSGVPLKVNVNIPLNPIGEVDFSRDSHKLALELKVFYNGEKLNPYIHTDLKRPKDFYSSFILKMEERAAQVTLELPSPVSDDEGLYELQLFLKLNDVSLGFSPNCSNYLEFLDSYNDGLRLSTLLVGSATLMLHHYGAPPVVATATQQILSAGGAESLPILTCSVVENVSIELLDQLRWVKGSRELAVTHESGTVTFDTASINNTFPQESYFGTYQCEAFSSQDKTEESVHIAERAQFSMQLQSLNDISCHNLNEDVKQSLLNMLRMELEFSLSSAGDGDISSNNFINSSLTCSSDGSNIVVMSIDIVYSNSNGSITASTLVEMAEGWMNGIRTANGFAFQIDRPGTNNSIFTLDAGQLVGIVILCLVSILLFVAIIILVTCLILKHRNRLKEQEVSQTYPPNTGSTVNHSSMNIGSDSINTSIEGQSPHLSMSGNENQLPHRSHSSSQISSPHYSSPSIHSEARLLLNARTPSQVDTSRYSSESLTCTPNCAYNRMQDIIGGTNAQIQTRNPVSSSRQISVQYDYPELRFIADHSNEHMELSDTYDVITTMTRNK